MLCHSCFRYFQLKWSIGDAFIKRSRPKVACHIRLGSIVPIPVVSRSLVSSLSTSRNSFSYSCPLTSASHSPTYWDPPWSNAYRTLIQLLRRKLWWGRIPFPHLCDTMTSAYRCIVMRMYALVLMFTWGDKSSDSRCARKRLDIGSQI